MQDFSGFADWVTFIIRPLFPDPVTLVWNNNALWAKSAYPFLSCKAAYV